MNAKQHIIWPVALMLMGYVQCVQAQVSPVTLTWDYNAQQKTLTLHLANNSGKDITAYNISMLEKHADGSTDYLDGRQGDIHDHQHMEEMLGLIISVQAAKGTADEESFRRYGNGTFAAGTSRDLAMPELKDISNVGAIVDVVVFADGTAYVQNNDRAFKELLAARKGGLLAMQKVNGAIRRALADSQGNAPISVAVTELTQLADSLDAVKNRQMDDPEANVARSLRGRH